MSHLFMNELVAGIGFKFLLGVFEYEHYIEGTFGYFAFITLFGNFYFFLVVSFNRKWFISLYIYYYDINIDYRGDFLLHKLLYNNTKIFQNIDL